MKQLLCCLLLVLAASNAALSRESAAIVSAVQLALANRGPLAFTARERRMNGATYNRRFKGRISNPERVVLIRPENRIKVLAATRVHASAVEIAAANETSCARRDRAVEIGEDLAQENPQLF